MKVMSQQQAEMKLAKTEFALAEVIRERDKLQRFKDWTHAYLDRLGVPHHPPGTHGAEGCRIGDRMDWMVAHFKALGIPNQTEA